MGILVEKNASGVEHNLVTLLNVKTANGADTLAARRFASLRTRFESGEFTDVDTVVNHHTLLPVHNSGPQTKLKVALGHADHLVRHTKQETIDHCEHLSLPSPPKIQIMDAVIGVDSSNK